MDVRWGELESYKIDIDDDMLSFLIGKCLDEQREMYDSLNAQLSPMCFQPIFEEIHVNNSAILWLFLASLIKKKHFGK